MAAFFYVYFLSSGLLVYWSSGLLIPLRLQVMLITIKPGVFKFLKHNLLK